MSATFPPASGLRSGEPPDFFAAPKVGGLQAACRYAGSSEIDEIDRGLPGTGASLLERERELDVVRDALDRLADGQGSMLLIEGPAGIGKTRLLAAATELGRATRGSGAGGSSGTAGARNAVRRSRASCWSRWSSGADEAERSRLLSGSAALSLIAFGLEDSGGPNAEVDRFAPIHGLYWLLANLCDSQPVLIVIDDAHWADTQSLRWLDFLARRVADTPVLILVGARTGEADEPAELEPLRLDATERPAPLAAERRGGRVS